MLLKPILTVNLASYHKQEFDVAWREMLHQFQWQCSCEATGDEDVSIKLSTLQQRGVINLIPKEDSALNNLKIWRPITLLNLDYKIASKVIAKCVESLLQCLVHSDHTGFVEDRYISENIRLISDS